MHAWHTLHGCSDHTRTSAGATQEGAVAVIRISGAQAVAVAMDIFRSGHQQHAVWDPRSHRVYHGHACDDSGEILDEVNFLATCMLAPCQAGALTY